jgi:anti-sigma factor ChrR (cupin superfamily)
VVSGALHSPDGGAPCEEGDAVVDVDAQVEATALRDSVILELTRAAVVEVRETAGMDRGRIVRAAEGRWLPYAPGIEVSPIAHGGRDSLVALRLTTGATLDDHEHDGVEELFVLSGSCVVERRPLREGDYHRANAGSEHAETQSGDDGCLLLVSLRPL